MEDTCKNCSKDCQFAEDKINGVCPDWIRREGTQDRDYNVEEIPMLKRVI